jgi:membrane-bound lytic murein transglycosylase D
VLVLALLQACASQPPSAPEPGAAPEQPESLPAPAPAAKAPLPQPPKPRARSSTPVVVAAPPVDAASLPPFEGQREVVIEPLRGVKTIDRTAGPAEDIWQRIRRGFAMPDLDNALVRRKTAEYARA